VYENVKLNNQCTMLQRESARAHLHRRVHTISIKREKERERPVHDAAGMAVREGVNNLYKKSRGLGFVEPPVVSHISAQVASCLRFSLV
jgi:hypothetical protein